MRQPNDEHNARLISAVPDQRYGHCALTVL